MAGGLVTKRSIPGTRTALTCSTSIILRAGSNRSTQTAKRLTRRGLRIGIDRIPEGLPLEGKHPGPLHEDHPDSAPCVLYRVALNIGKRFAEADLYTTEPVIIPVEMME